jgi:dipeptidase E
MTLVFFSGNPCAHICPVTDELRSHLKRITAEAFFIPADDHDVDGEFQQTERWMKDLGVARVELLRCDRKVSRAAMRNLAQAALVFIGGGNTFYLMKHINSSGIGDALRSVHHGDGVLAGQSAGAIIMTPTIHTAAFPDFDRDDNIVGLRRMKGLGLVDFEFFPHFINRPRYSRSLRRYSRIKQQLVYGSDDNGGIVVADNRVIFIGNVWGFWGGMRVRICSEQK